MTTTGQQAWAEAVSQFSCPFCGRPAGEPCQAIKDDILTAPRDLVKPHENRLQLLTETDPSVKGSFSLNGSRP